MKREQEKLIVNNFAEDEVIESSFLRSAAGMFFVLLAAVIVVVYFAGDFVTVLTFPKSILKLLLGRCWLVPVILFSIVGTNILSNDDYGFFSVRNIFLVLIFLVIPAIVHHITVSAGKELFPDILREANGGGFIGGLVVLLFHKVFGTNNSFFVLVSVLFVSFVCLLPYKDIFKVIALPFVFLKRWISGKKDIDIIDEQDEYDEDFEESKYVHGIDSSANEKQKLPCENKVPVFDTKNKSTCSKMNERKSLDDFLSARSIIASRRDTEKVEEKQADSSVIDDIYNRKEFRGFSDGVRKENILKRIMSRRSGDNVYNQPGIRENLKENPMDIPNWQGDVSEEDVNDSSENTIDNTADNEVETSEFVLKSTASKYRRDEKVIPLYEELPTEVGNLSVPQREEVVIKHYRESAEDDVYADEDRNITPDNSVIKPKLSRIRYKYPKTDLLDKPKHLNSMVYEKDIQKQCGILKQTLADFSVNAKVVGVTRGPSITRFEITPAPGVKVSTITSLADDIALNLAAGGVRIEAPIPGKAAIGIEVPNIQNDAVYFKEIVDAQEVKQADSPLCIGLGKDVSGNIITIDLTKMPHLLVAGSTGSGKSVCINTLIGGILYKAHPEEVKLILVDPKVVELSNYNGIPHLLTPVVTDMKKAASALQWARKEMERRYQLFAENHAREISSYNLGAKVKLPYIVVIIDELSDLMMVARIDVEDAILALAQKARAAGIHLVLATQRPSVDVITGVIKANIPSRISFAVSSQTDSRTILDMGGAEKLIGKGDMLYCPIGVNKPLRVQGAFISDGEIQRVTEFVVEQNYHSDFVEEVTSQNINSVIDKVNESNSDNNQDDDIFLDVVRLVKDTGQVSASMLQRKFRIGYTRAARLVDALEELGIVGQASGSKPRELIISREELESRFLNE